MHRLKSIIFCLDVMAVHLLVTFDSKADVAQDSSNKYFKIQVVDRQTGRGVPLVELRTTNNARYYTDSNGIVAYYEPGLMDREVFFFLESHGYEFPKDGFGFNGTRLKTSPGTSAVIKIDRLNIAERLYRVTGQGIYRDSILTDTLVPLKNPVINGQVTGQDSVFTCIYHGRLFWMWGDTSRPSYPLGNFAMSGAFSDLPERGGLDPSLGVDLEYYVDEGGFSRPMSPLKEPGLVWLDGLLTVQDPQGNERMVAKFARLKGLSDVLERGLMVFNDETETFEPLVRGDLEFLPYRNTGHAFGVEVDGQPYYYFTSPSPMGARLRVRARWDDVIDSNRYEVLTSLVPSLSDNNRIDLGQSKADCRWVTFAEIIASQNKTKDDIIEALEQEAKGVKVYDVETGKSITPHNGSVYFNAYRKRWIGIFVQQFGESSFLGEVWYAEADTPVGPWVYARKIVTHNKYSFYNPKQHPFFDKEGGRIIFFEGTYSHTFSGSAETATPRYDYNQIMYCLNLDDPRLAVPVAVYQIRDENDQRYYLLLDGVENTNQWDSVESIPFYVVEPKRTHEDLVPIYVDKGLTAKRPNSSAEPLFYALSANETQSENSCIAPLYEYHNSETEQSIYSTKPTLQGWRRTPNPLC
ncbi:MAG: hypothetical protein JXA81_16695, partial [Sedimentisphaerales bacterium]|nr:hypothetical protein [Sedimentisphaerales bacterium]